MFYYKIKKVINNSVVMVQDKNEEVILLGKGIGFQKKENDIIYESTKIEKKYQLIQTKNNTGERDKQMLPFIALVIELMDKSTTNNFSYTTMKSLTDHIAAMYLRIINNENLENPFHYETKSLYSKDYQTGLQIGEEIFKITGLKVPESELDFLTLYIHYGNSNDAKAKMDLIHSIIYQVSSLLSDKYNIKFNKDSIDYSRFIVHLRFVVERIMRREDIPDINLKDLFMNKFKKYYKIGQDIVSILENELHTVITDDERVYLLLHIARLDTMNSYHNEI